MLPKKKNKKRTQGETNFTKWLVESISCIDPRHSGNLRAKRPFIRSSWDGKIVYCIMNTVYEGRRKYEWLKQWTTKVWISFYTKGYHHILQSASTQRYFSIWFLFSRSLLEEILKGLEKVKEALNSLFIQSHCLIIPTWLQSIHLAKYPKAFSLYKSSYNLVS